MGNPGVHMIFLPLYFPLHGHSYWDFRRILANILSIALLLLMGWSERPGTMGWQQLITT